jgi:heat shock protein HslJ
VGDGGRYFGRVIRSSLAGLVVALVAGSPLLGCSVAGPTLQPATIADLEQTEWRASSYFDHGVERDLVAGTSVRVEFAASTALAEAGCNSLSGRYELSGDRLIVHDPAQTLIGCDAAKADQDRWLFSLMSSRPRVGLDGINLVVRSADYEVRLEPPGLCCGPPTPSPTSR